MPRAQSRARRIGSWRVCSIKRRLGCRAESFVSFSADRLGRICTSLTDVQAPAILERCRKGDSACRHRNEISKNRDLFLGSPPPPSHVQVRYEFDLGDRGLKFARALRKLETEENSQWLAVGLDDCAGDAVLVVADNPLNVPNRPPAVPETIWEAAEKGDAGAIKHIATMYDRGQGVPQDYLEAIRWYRLAAAKGDDFSMSRIGFLYHVGTGVQQSDAEALRWMRMSADKGNAYALGVVGGAYYNGLGVPEN